MNEKYTNVIKKNLLFQETDRTDITYQFQSHEYQLLEAEYHIAQVAGDNDLLKALNLLEWVNLHIRHTGNYDNSDTQDAMTLLAVAFDKDYGINCLAMSIILCECLLAVQVKARVMYMMPQEAEDGDNHVVVEAFVQELGKWIMLDPTYGSYCTDLQGNILNLYEIREAIAEDEEYFFCDKLNYNGNKDVDLADLKDYYAKNLFFLRCKSCQGYGLHREYGNMLEIAPLNFDVHERMVKNLQYRIQEYGDFPLFTIWKNYEESLCNKYVSIEQLYATPMA